MTTTLQAVQRIASALGLPRPIALETGQNTDAGKIETILDETNSEIQKLGIACNRRLNYDIALPTKKIAASGGSGTFTFGETITETTSGATGVFNYETGGFIYIAPVSGAFAGSLTLTGGTSGATRTGAALTTLTEGLIAIPSTWIMVSGGSSEPRRLSTQGAFLFDAILTTTTFDSDVSVSAVELLAFSSLPQHWAEAVLWAAAVDAQRSFKRAQVDEYLLMDKSHRAMSQARNLDQTQSPINIFDNPSGERVTGSRTFSTRGFIRYT